MNEIKEKKVRKLLITLLQHIQFDPNPEISKDKLYSLIDTIIKIMNE